MMANDKYSLEKKVFKSGVWYTASNFVLKALYFFTAPIFTRLMTKTEYGEYANYTSWQNIFNVIVTLNVSASLISAKYDYEGNLDGYTFSVLVMSTLSAGIWLIASVIFGGFSSALFSMKPSMLTWMILYLLFLVAVDLYQAKERYMYRYKSSVYISLLISILALGLSVVLVILSEDRLWGRIFGATLPTILVGFIIYIFMWKKGRTVDFTTWKYALPLCLPYIPHLLSLILLNSMDKVMITRLCGAESTALYSVAYTCGAAVTVLLTSMNTAYAPWLGDKLAEGKYDDIRRFSYKYILGFCLLALLIMLLGPEILQVMGGDTYKGAIGVLPPVAMGCVCQFLYTMFVNIEQFKKKTFGMAWASMTAALVNLILNALCIPKYGYVSAAYTTLVGYLSLLIIHMFLVKKINYDQVYNYKFVLGVTFGMILLTILVNFIYWLTFLRMGISAVIIGTLIIYAYVRKDKLLKLIK